MGILFRQHKWGFVSLIVIILISLLGIYAPFFASSQPIVVKWDNAWYFPLFRYLFYPGFYSKKIDIFFNLLMFTLPILFFLRKAKYGLAIGCALQVAIFSLLVLYPPKDPKSDPELIQKRQHALKILRKKDLPITWQFELQYMNSYAKLNEILHYYLSRQESVHVLKYLNTRQREGATLWQMQRLNLQKQLQRSFDSALSFAKQGNQMAFLQSVYAMKYILDKQQWLKQQNAKISFLLMPLLRPYHWEDDVGRDDRLNRFLPFFEIVRINGKDLTAALIFGVRISLVVGLLAVAIALFIGISLGAFAGYYGGTFDIVACRLLEIWESMPTFFMLLFIVAITESKSIFLVIAIIGLFGWTSFCRFVRGEFFKQRNLPYVEACLSQGFNDFHVIFSHILPNAIAPVLTLLPFSIMAAISTEAGLSFLGLGEENTCSWGVLMEEGRSVFPGASNLLWPPAILLTILLVAIALLGDALRDVLDPKMR